MHILDVGLHVQKFVHCLGLKLLDLITEMWCRSRRLGLETVSRRSNVSSQSRLGSRAIASR